MEQQLTTVLAVPTFNEWYLALNEKDQAAVLFSIGLLREQGVTLPFPHSSAIVGSKWSMRELRVQSGGRPLRIFYVFDPDRQAILLLGGEKTGKDRFYKQNVRKADKLYEEYLEALRRSKSEPKK